MSDEILGEKLSVIDTHLSTISITSKEEYKPQQKRLEWVDVHWDQKIWYDYSLNWKEAFLDFLKF